MEMLDKLTAWLRRNVWCFVVAAVLTIFWMAAFWYAGQGAAIATWLSIILAVVVIIYTFFETYRSGQRLSEMRELVRKGQDILAIKADELKKETKSMREIQEDLAKYYSEVQKAPSLEVKTEPSTGPKFQLNLASCEWAQLFALYCIARSHKSKHSLDLDLLTGAMYPDPSFTRGSPLYQAALWQLSGIFKGISCFLESGSVLLTENSLIVTKFPDEASDLISNNIQMQLDEPDMPEVLKNIKKMIDIVIANPPVTEKSKK